MSEDRSSQIKSIMATVFSVEPAEILDDTTTFTVESWDSLKHMNLIVALEKEFDKTFDDDEILEMVSFKSILEKVG